MVFPAKNRLTEHIVWGTYRVLVWGGVVTQIRDEMGRNATVVRDGLKIQAEGLKWATLRSGLYKGTYQIY